MPPIVRGRADNRRKSPWPLVTVMIAPDGKMRGPETTPSSIARLRPNVGPPTSRTVVKPRISVSDASAPATRLLKPTSPSIAWAGVGRISIACQCASISPGISVRPPPLTSVAPSLLIGLAETSLIRLPSTRTFAFMIRCGFTPSKTWTFVNRVFGFDSGCCASAGTLIAMAAIARTPRNLFIVFLFCLTIALARQRPLSCVM
jgi:hypothetical protein